MTDKRYEHSEKVFWRLYRDGVIAIHHETNEIILLNSAGAAIWPTLSSPRTIQQVASFLQVEFEVDPDLARTDANEFLSSLLLKGFVKVTGETENLERKFGEIQNGESNRDYSEKHEVLRWAARNLIPVSVQVELTHRCNLHCTHCYLSARFQSELDVSSFEKIARQLKDTGTLFLTLTGGEPLLYSDLKTILDIAILQCGFSTTIFTNGTIKRRDWKDIITRYSFKEVHVSLYSLQADVHDRITGVKGSQILTLNFVQQLRHAGVRVVIKSPLFRQTIEEAASLRRYAKEIGAEWSGGPLITPRDNGDMSPTAMRADREQIVSYFQELEEGSLLVKADSVQDALHGSVSGSPLACLALSNSCFIDVRGDLYPCSQVRQKIGNVLDTPFKKLWYEPPILTQIRETRLSDLPACSNCELLPYCSRCPGLADLEGKNILGPSPFDCILAQCRKRAQQQLHSGSQRKYKRE